MKLEKNEISVLKIQFLESKSIIIVFTVPLVRGIVPRTTFVSPYKNESMSTRKLGIFLLSTATTNRLVHFVQLFVVFFAKRERERERERELLMELAVVSREEKLTEGEQSHRKEKKEKYPAFFVRQVEVCGPL